MRREREVGEDWVRRARVLALGKEMEGEGGIWLGTVWGGMNGLLQVDQRRGEGRSPRQDPFRAGCRLRLIPLDLG